MSLIKLDRLRNKLNSKNLSNCRFLQQRKKVLKMNIRKQDNNYKITLTVHRKVIMRS